MLWLTDLRLCPRVTLGQPHARRGARVGGARRRRPLHTDQRGLPTVVLRVLTRLFGVGMLRCVVLSLSRCFFFVCVNLCISRDVTIIRVHVLKFRIP